MCLCALGGEEETQCVRVTLHMTNLKAIEKANNIYHQVYQDWANLNNLIMKYFTSRESVQNIGKVSLHRNMLNSCNVHFLIELH